MELSISEWGITTQLTPCWRLRYTPLFAKNGSFVLEGLPLLRFSHTFQGLCLFVVLALGPLSPQPASANAPDPNYIFIGLSHPLQIAHSAVWGDAQLTARHRHVELTRHLRILQAALSRVSELLPAWLEIHPFNVPEYHHDRRFNLSIILADAEARAITFQRETSSGLKTFQLDIPRSKSGAPQLAVYPRALKGANGETKVHSTFIVVLRLDLLGGLISLQQPAGPAAVFSDDELFNRYFVALYGFFAGRLSVDLEFPVHESATGISPFDNGLYHLEADRRKLEALLYLRTPQVEARLSDSLNSKLKNTEIPTLLAQSVESQRLFNEWAKQRSKGRPYSPLVVPADNSQFFGSHYLSTRPAGARGKIGKFAADGLSQMDDFLEHRGTNSPGRWRNHHWLLRQKNVRLQLLSTEEWRLWSEDMQFPIQETDEYFAVNLIQGPDRTESVLVVSFFADRIFFDDQKHRMFTRADERWRVALARAYFGPLLGYLETPLYEVPGFQRRYYSGVFAPAGHAGAMDFLEAVPGMSKTRTALVAAEQTRFHQAGRCLSWLLAAAGN